MPRILVRMLLGALAVMLAAGSVRAAESLKDSTAPGATYTMVHMGAPW